MAYKIDGQVVSKPWHNVLLHYRRMGANFTVTSGRRTIRGQLAMVRKHGVYNARTNPTGAALPSPAAPHINFGRANHAIDVWGTPALLHRLHADGARSASRPMSSEPWHIQIDRNDLLRLDTKIRKNRK